MIEYTQNNPFICPHRQLIKSNKVTNVILYYNLAITLQCTGKASGTIIPGDNPSYGARDGLDTAHDSAGYQEIPPNPNTQVETASSPQGRDFDNPIYGSQEEVQDREFENPIYSTEDSEVQGEESENPYYATPGSPPSNIYDRVADDQPVDS